MAGLIESALRALLAGLANSRFNLVVQATECAKIAHVALVVSVFLKRETALEHRIFNVKDVQSVLLALPTKQLHARTSLTEPALLAVPAEQTNTKPLPAL